MQSKTRRRCFFLLPALSVWWTAWAQVDYPSDSPSFVPSLAVSAISSDMPSVNPSSAQPGPSTFEPSTSAVPSKQDVPSSRPNRPPSPLPNPSPSPIAGDATHAPTRRRRPSSKPTAGSPAPTTTAQPQGPTNCTISQGFFNPICIGSGFYSQYACFDYRLFSSYIVSSGCSKPIKVRFDSCSDSFISRRLSEGSIMRKTKYTARARVARGLNRRQPRIRTKNDGPKRKDTVKGPKGDGKNSISKKIQFAATGCSQTCVRVDQFLCLRASSSTDDTTILRKDFVIRISYTVSDASGTSAALEFGVRVTDSPACYNPSSTCSVANLNNNATKSIDRRRRRKGII